MEDNSSTASNIYMDQKLEYMKALINGMQAKLEGDEQRYPPLITEGILQLSSEVDTLRKISKRLEEDRKSLRALAQIGQVVNSTLELDIVLQIVMDTIVRLTHAERGFLMLKDNTGILKTRVARNWEQESLPDSELTFSSTIVNSVIANGKPLLTTNAQQDPRFVGQESVIAFNLRSIMCVPMKTKDEITGVIYTDNRIKTGMFGNKDLDLLVGFANQASFAIENARLFDSVRRTLDEVSRLKSLMDHVFASVASGVLTIDLNGRILTCNKAAETILGKSSVELFNQSLAHEIPSLALAIRPAIAQLVGADQTNQNLESSLRLPVRGEVSLHLKLTPLKDGQDNTQGVVIVMDDLTDKKRLEEQRKLFEKMVSPAVIAQLETSNYQMGGRRTEITVLFADLRGFTNLSEEINSEELVAILNRYLANAAEAILQEGGTIDKFLGDAVMAWFNAPVKQSDHVLRAIRSAVAIHKGETRIHKELAQKTRLRSGIGIHCGPAIMGLIGMEERMDYTAIGDTVNIAKRLQESSLPGTILISEDVYRRAGDILKIKPLEQIQAKGKREPINVFEVIGFNPSGKLQPPDQGV
jgi:PAS domain S-box-containing protein